MATEKWRESLIDPKSLKWRLAKTKTVDDDKYDLNIKVPLTKLVEAQARQSYILGVNSFMQFFIKAQTDGKPISTEMLIEYFTTQGYPEIAERFLAQMMQPTTDQNSAEQGNPKGQEKAEETK